MPCQRGRGVARAGWSLHYLSHWWLTFTSLESLLLLVWSGLVERSFPPIAAHQFRHLRFDSFFSSSGPYFFSSYSSPIPSLARLAPYRSRPSALCTAVFENRWADLCRSTQCHVIIRFTQRPAKVHARRGTDLCGKHSEQCGLHYRT